MALQLLEKAATGQAGKTDLAAGKLKVLGKPGVRFEIVDSATSKTPLNIVVKKVGDNALLLIDDIEVEIEGFYAQGATSEIALVPLEGAPEVITPASTPLAQLADGSSVIHGLDALPATAAGPLAAPLLGGMAGPVAGGAAVAGAAAGGSGAGGVAAVSNTLLGGKVADGYVSGATVFADANGNGRWDDGEAKTTTDAQGNYTLTNPVGTIIATGGTNIDTGLPNTLTLKAPAGATVINPLTTLIQAYAVAHGSTTSAAEAAVQGALGIAGNLDLLTYDPLAGAGDATVQKVVAKLATTLILAGSQGNVVIDNIVAAIDTIVASGTPLDLTNLADLGTVLNGVTTVTTNAVAASTTLI